jgi:poly-gamma-glutamate synthesis protein (capsule biosynthesis protein)
MRKVFVLSLFLCRVFTLGYAQGNAFVSNDKYDSLRIMLVGDLQQSNGQVAAAYDPANKSYDYSNCFRYVQPLFGVSDVVIGNLETTFSGKPYGSNPFYSAPEQFALALKYAGFNCLMTANDHCADRDKEGMVKTIRLLDSLGIHHTGTFLNAQNKVLNNPLMIERNGFSIAILNYTFGTKYNVADTNMVNLINLEKMKQDLFSTEKLHPDFTIVYLHWGTEYERFPNEDQRALAKMCFDNGADFVAGSNPHVLQKAEEMQFYSYGTLKKGFVAYSLGNFISDYDRRYGDGAAMMEVILCKEKKTGLTRVSDYGFIPTYVVKDDGMGNKPIRVVPVSEVESKHISVDIALSDLEKMKVSGTDSRSMMNTASCQESKYKLNDDIINDVAETIVLTGAAVNTDHKDLIVFTTQKSIHKNPPIENDEVKTESIVEAKASSIKAIETSTVPTKSISSNKISVGQMDIVITNEERKKDSIVEASKRSQTIISTNNTIASISNNPVMIAKLDTFISKEVREKDSVVLLDKIKVTEVPTKTIAPVITTSVAIVSKIDKVISNDKESKKDSSINSPDPVIVPPGRTLEDDIFDLEEKFKKYGSITYKVKFYDMPTKIEINTYYYKYLEGYVAVQENGNWVYYLGNSTSFDEAKLRCLSLRAKGLKKISIVPFVNGKKIDWTIQF